MRETGCPLQAEGLVLLQFQPVRSQAGFPHLGVGRPRLVGDCKPSGYLFLECYDYRKGIHF